MYGEIIYITIDKKEGITNLCKTIVGKLNFIGSSSKIPLTKFALSNDICACVVAYKK